MEYQLAQPLLLFLQPLDVCFARAIEPAAENELYHLVKLTPIEERAVLAARVDDGP